MILALFDFTLAMFITGTVGVISNIIQERFHPADDAGEVASDTLRYLNHNGGNAA